MLYLWSWIILCILDHHLNNLSDKKKVRNVKLHKVTEFILRIHYPIEDNSPIRGNRQRILSNLNLKKSALPGPHGMLSCKSWYYKVIQQAITAIKKLEDYKWCDFHSLPKAWTFRSEGKERNWVAVTAGHTQPLKSKLGEYKVVQATYCSFSKDKMEQ